MGFTSYCDVAAAAYVGCLAGLGARLQELVPDIVVEDVSGLEAAYDEVIDRVGDEGKVVLPEKSFLTQPLGLSFRAKRPNPSSSSVCGPARKSQSLQNKLTGFDRLSSPRLHS